YFDYAGFGERSKQNLNYSQAVRIEYKIGISGQGGWDRISEAFPADLSTEIDQAFDNVEHTRQYAGETSLEQIYKLLYITDSVETCYEPIARNMKGRLRFKNHGPLLTVVQVKALYSVMRMEFEAEAYLG
ncbi:hypothetical protein T440DRAFT_388133, partial [Plenodomus tracheiphilus IPT5]